MSTLIRHGGNAHYLRADRVYRTGVLSPMVGFQPQADVQAIAQEFTQGPPLGTMLGGLGDNVFTRLGLRIKAWFAQKRANAMIAQANAAAASQAANGNPVPSIPVAPASANAAQVAPQIATQMQMLHQFGPQGHGIQRHAIAQAADVAAERRYFTYYRAG